MSIHAVNTLVVVVESDDMYSASLVMFSVIVNKVTVFVPPVPLVSDYYNSH